MPHPLEKVYAGHIIPIMVDEGKVTHVYEAPIEEYKNVIVGELFQNLKKYGRYVLKKIYGKEITDIAHTLEDINKLAEYLRQINDYIIGFFKLTYAPITIPKKREAPVGPPSPVELYWLWTLTRISHELREIWNQSLIGIIDKLGPIYKLIQDQNAIEALLNLTKPLTDLNEFEKRVSLILHIPADTRPGLNTSKLIPHLLSVSALSIAKYMNKYGYMVSLEREILRLASILHDIGKPLAWIYGISHVEASRELVKELKDIIPMEVLNLVLMLIEHHHDPDKLPEYGQISKGVKVKLKELGKILNISDKESSTIDRLVDLVSDYLSEKLGIGKGEVRRVLIGVGEPIWEFWYKLGYAKIKELTEEVSRKLLEKSKELLQIRDQVISDTALISIDVKGIQRFISRENIRMLTASSIIIDLFTTYIVPRALRESLNLPPENIIYAGGGFVVAVIPRKAKEELSRIEEFIKNCKNRILSEYIDIGFTIAVEDLYIDWPTSMYKLVTILSTKKKISLSPSPTIKLGITVNCELCRINPAVIRIRGTNILACKECEKIREMGKSLYIETRLKRLKAYGYSEVNEELSKIESVMDKLIQWFSGHERWIEGVGGEVAIVKADGNFMGRFMATALSLTDAMERSIRIDLGLKKGIGELLEKIKDDVETLKRVYTGIMYAGGDDFLAIWPSYIALPAALYIAYWYWFTLGGESQLSIGIAIGKPKHNIWALLDASTSLLKKSKSLSRKLKEEYEDILSNIIAMISFLHSEQQLFPSDIEYILKTYKDKHLTLQPYALTLPDKTTHIYKLGYGVINDLIRIIHRGNGKVKDLLENFIEIALSIRKGVEENREKLRHLRTLAMQLNNIASLSPTQNIKDVKLTVLTYLARERARSREIEAIEKAKAEIIKDMAEIYIEADMLPPLYDIYVFSKILMGGII